MRRIPTALAGAAVLAGLVAGCSSGPEPRDVTVGPVDYEFTGLPDELAAGSVLSIDNQSDDELHELVAIRLPDGEERTGEELLQLPPEELGAFFGGVQAVLLQPPGSDEVILAEGDGTLADAGRYLVICAIPTGAAPQEYLAAAAAAQGGPPEGVDGGPPHFANGMWTELTVVE